MAQVPVLGSISTGVSVVELAQKLVRTSRAIYKSERDWEIFAREAANLSKALEPSENGLFSSDSPAGNHNSLDMRLGNEFFEHIQALLSELESKVANKPSNLPQKMAWQYTKDECEELLGAIHRAQTHVMMQRGELMSCVPSTYSLNSNANGYGRSEQGLAYQADLASLSEELSAMKSQISLLSRSVSSPRLEDFESREGARPWSPVLYTKFHSTLFVQSGYVKK
jgi:hypothetical protein